MTASTVSLEEYAAAFTAAFQGYFFPLTLDALTLARKIRLEQHDLQHSVVAYLDGEIVGVAALAVRGEAGWVGGFGLVPEQRGRGRGRELMSAILEQARACRLRQLSLEVLVQNTGARKLYEGAGMRVARDLLIFERAASPVVGAKTLAAKGDSTEVAKSDFLNTEVAKSDLLNDAMSSELLTHFARLHVVQPAWQRQLPALLVGNLQGFYLGERTRPDAYALLGSVRDGFTYISDLAAADAAHARALCDALKGFTGALKIINEPEHGLFTGPLLANGFVEAGRQHEMVIDL